MVRSNRILTDLAADGGRVQTFIDVLAGFAVWHEPVTGVAGAEVTGEGVGAKLRTLVEGWVSALIDSWMERRKENKRERRQENKVTHMYDLHF